MNKIFRFIFQKVYLFINIMGNVFGENATTPGIELDDDGFFLMNSSRKSLFLPWLMKNL